MTKLDGHHHFWMLENQFTDWPTPDLDLIYRDFGVDDLAPLLANAGFTGTILVQAAPSVDETRYLLDLASITTFVLGVVGWIDFEGPDALAQLAELSTDPNLVGLRPMLQSIPQTDWILNPAFTPVFEDMVHRGLVLDGLVTWEQIDQLTALANRHPQLAIVLDHCGKPPIVKGRFQEWAEAIDRFAANPNAACKLSGLWTEAGTDLSADAMRPWVNHVVAAFGSDRLIWGSDWPVLGLAGSYAAWMQQCEDLLAELGQSACDAIFGLNGRRIYGLG